MRKLAVAASALIALGMPVSNAWAQDLHSPSRSPEGSPGVDPGITRGVERGIPPVTPALEPRRELPTGTTTITSARWTASVPERPADRVRPARSMLLTGAAIFLGSYVATAITTATVGKDADRWGVVPVAGPWLALGNRSSSCAIGDCGFPEDVNVAGLIASGLAQAAGLGLSIVALFLSERYGRF